MRSNLLFLKIRSIFDDMVATGPETLKTSGNYHLFFDLFFNFDFSLEYFKFKIIKIGK